MRRLPIKTGLSAFVTILAIAGAIAYVSAPPKGLDGYRERAAASAATLASHVETALLWAETRSDGKATGAAALVGFEESEAGASATALQFEGYEPPEDAAALRSRFVVLAGRVEDALSQLRIAAQREQWDRLPALSDPLPSLSDQLRRFEERAEP